MKTKLLGTLLVAALAACGPLGDADDPPPTMATLEGQLTNTASATGSSSTRIAVLWFADRSKEKTPTQDIPATPLFPSKFRIEINAPPPPQAMLSFKESKFDMPGAAALGAVIAYEDLNGNGKLDMIEPNTPFVDRVLGVNRELQLFYLEGNDVPPPLVAKDGSKPPPGFSLLRRTVCPPTVYNPYGPGGPQTKDCDDDLLAVLPMTTLYELPLTADSAFQNVMCLRGANYLSASGRVMAPPPVPQDLPPGVYGLGWYEPTPGYLPSPEPPSSSDPMVICSPDGSTFNYSWCKAEPVGNCEEPLESCTMSRFESPKDRPGNWPCPRK